MSTVIEKAKFYEGTLPADFICPNEAAKPAGFLRATTTQPPFWDGTGTDHNLTVTGVSLVVMTSSRCSPSQTLMASVPKTESECIARMWEPLPSELRALASELADELPDWSSTKDPSVDLDYEGLKAAAVKFASVPWCV